MATIPRPSRDEILDRMIADIDGRLEGPNPRLPRSPLEILVKTYGGAIHELYGHAASALEDLLPDTATGDALDRIASLYSVTRVPPDFAVFNLVFNGTNNTVIAAGTRVRRDADGLELETLEEVSIQGTQQLVDASPTVPGVVTDFGAGTTYTLSSPIEGIDSAVEQTFDSQNPGVDLESDDSLRARLLSEIRSPIEGGTVADFERWALEISGVTRAFVEPPDPGASLVNVRIVNDNLIPPNPSAQLLTDVQAYLSARKPAGAQVATSAPTLVPMNPEIQLTPNTAEVQAAVEAELRALLVREGGCGSTVLLSHIREAISLSQGETDHTLVSPVADVVAAVDEVITLGVVTWS